MAELLALDEAVRRLVRDGDSVALEGLPPTDDERRVLRGLKSALEEATA